MYHEILTALPSKASLKCPILLPLPTESGHWLDRSGAVNLLHKINQQLVQPKL